LSKRFNSISGPGFSRFFPLINLGIALLTYLFTLAPTLSWGDSSDLAQRTIRPDYDPLKFDLSTRDYDLYRFLSGLTRHLPFSDAAYAANFTSAIFGSITIGLITYLATILTRNSVAGLISGLSLLVSHTFWLMSVIAEVYTFTLLLVLSTFVWMTKWLQTKRVHFLYIGSLNLGLLVSHHPSGLVAAFCCLLYFFIKKVELKCYQLFLSGLLLISGSYFYIRLVIHRLSLDLSFLEALAVLPPQNLLTNQSEFLNLFMYILFLVYNFIGIGLILILFALIKDRSYFNKLMIPPLVFSITMILLGVTSSIPDKYNIYVLTYPGISLLVGLGYVVLSERFMLKNTQVMLIIFLLVSIPPIFYYSTYKISESLNKDFSQARQLTLRNNAEYFLWPAKNGDYGPRRYAELALEKVSKNGVLIADYTLYMPLVYLQSVENVRNDVEVVFVESLFDGPFGVSNYLGKTLPNRRIYLATDEPNSYYQLDTVLLKFTITSKFPIYEVNFARKI
jgi:hypothetical protein